MQDQLKNLVEAVRSGRGMDQAMLAAQVELLVANNPGRATAHDPASAGPDDLQRRLCATVQACGDAAIAPAVYAWSEVEEICAVLIQQIANLEPAPKAPSYLMECSKVANAQTTKKMLDAMPEPPGPVADNRVWKKYPAEPRRGVWKKYPEYCPDGNGNYEVLLASGEHTVRDAVKVCGTCVFPTALDPMNEVVEWFEVGFEPLDPVEPGNSWLVYPVVLPQKCGKYKVRLVSGEISVRNTVIGEECKRFFPDGFDHLHNVAEWWG